MDAKVYKETKKSLNGILEKGMIPNLKAIKAELAKIRKKIRIIEVGTPMFARSKEDAEKASARLEYLTAQEKAYKEFLAYCKKMMENSAA